MNTTYTVTIRKPDIKCIPRNKLFTSSDDIPNLSIKDIQVYYNNTFKLSFNNNDYNHNDISNMINNIYDYINSHTQYTVNYGDIIELSNEIFYFFYLDPIKIN